MIIYKITNQVNNKIYIGLTTETLQERWSGHLQAYKTCKRHLYESMRKYGIENFTIEEIDKADSFEELGQLERKYIREYDSQNPEKGYNITAGGERNQLDANPRARLTVEEVKHIRELYSMCELSCKECWQIYKSKISFSAFQKIWEGTTWKSIMPEVYTKENIEIHKIQIKKFGGDNRNALYSNEEVLEIRKFYVTHSLTETYNKFGSKSTSKCGFRNLIDRTYSNVPMYLKKNKCWTLNNKIIDINNYNPVSTILESEE